MTAQAIGKYRWTICALLFFATTINYLDRQVLSLLKPMLEEKFGWSNSQYADIASVFQFTYAISMLFAGRFIDRLGTKKGFIITIVLWSTGAVIHSLAIPIGESLLALTGWLSIVAVPASVLGFMFARALLAIGESGNFPAAIKTTAEYFPQKERSFATGIFNSGANVGAILAPLTVPWIAANWGWQAAFAIIGTIGFIWLIFWLRFYLPPHKQTRLSAAELQYINGDSITTSVDNGKVSWFKLLQ